MVWLSLPVFVVPWTGSKNKPHQCSICVCMCFSIPLIHGPPSVHGKHTWIFYPPTPGLRAAKAATFPLDLLAAISHPLHFSEGSQTTSPPCPQLQGTHTMWPYWNPSYQVQGDRQVPSNPHPREKGGELSTSTVLPTYLLHKSTFNFYSPEFFISSRCKSGLRIIHLLFRLFL